VATKKKESRDGIVRIGAERGQLKFRLRLVARHPDTGEKVVDTIRVILADSKPAAMAMRQTLIDELLAEKLGELRVGRKLTFAEATDLWHATITRHATASSWGSYARKLKAVFGDRQLEKIRTEDMQRYLASLGYARSTLKGIKAVLVGIFDWSVDAGYVRKPGPARDLRLPKKQRDHEAVLAELERTAPVKRGLTHDELARFLPALKRIDGDLYPLVLVQLAIGARFSEASALKRSDVNMETGALVIRRGQVYGRIGPPKKDKSRPGALPATALEELRTHLSRMDKLKWPGHEEWLFPARPTRRRKFAPLWSMSTARIAIKAAMDEVGATTVNATHFARHTLNGLIRGHVTDSVLRTVVGHADEQMSASYGDARVLDFAAEVDRVVLARHGGSAGGSLVESDDHI
jgi:integrase